MPLSTVPKILLKTVSTMSRAAFCALLGLCLLAGLTPRADAASAASYVVTRTADDNLPGSLRSAIAQAAGTGGTITFAIPSTDPGYSSAANTDTITLALGPLVIPASLTIAGPAAPATTVAVSGANLGFNTGLRVFSVTGGTVAISNLTITQGYSDGGILNAAALTLNNCAVTHNFSSSGLGGGIANSGPGASLTLNDCTLSANTGNSNVPGGAGGISNSGTLTAMGCLLTDNTGGAAAVSVAGLYNTGVVTLDTCTITTSEAGGDQGIGAYNGGPGASLTMTDCTVSENGGYSGNGGGIVNSGLDASMTLNGCAISHNLAGFEGSGGGVTNSGTLTATGCLIYGNGSGEFGTDSGGLLNTGRATLNGCTISSNSGGDSRSGGGISNNGFEVLGGILYNSVSDTSLTLNGCLVAFNDSSYGNGGGIVNNGGVLTLSTCTISSNSAVDGGGIANFGQAQITDCLIVSNVSYGGAAGMLNGGALTLTNSTFSGNVANPFSGSQEGGAYVPPDVGGLDSGPATLINDIFYFDTSTVSGAPLPSEIIPAAGTMGPTITFSDVQGGDGNGTDPLPGMGNIDADPRFVLSPVLTADFLGFHSDPGDEHLLPTSPAVHAGTNGPGVPLTDIESTIRPTPPDAPSLGAYEALGSIGGFSAQGGFLIAGSQGRNTGSQTVAKFLPGTTPGASFTATVDFGDGAGPVPAAISPDPTTPSVFDVTSSHTYAGFGAFTVTVVIKGPGGTPTATVTSMANAQQVATDVTSQVSISRSGFIAIRGSQNYFGPQRYLQRVTIKNTSSATLPSLISLVLDNLTPGATLTGTAGTTRYASPEGSPFQFASYSDLAPGATLSLVLQFTYAGTARFGYTPRVLAGPGTP